ncbi:hypothetical protein PI124_g11692 [Phytophthora idaei]|nr:hypothetical protein PI124_g11692 [Phytophthora idaei]
MIVKYADGKPRPRRSATYATCVGPAGESRDILDVVELGFSRPDEQWLTRDEVVEHSLPQAVELGFHELPRVVKREVPDEVDAVESRIPYPDADPTSRCCESVDMIKRGFSSSAVESRFVVVVDESRVEIANRLSVQRQLRPKGSRSWGGGGGDDNAARVREVEVARPCDIAVITQLPGLSWKHFLRGLKRGDLEQICMVVPDVVD